MASPTWRRRQVAISYSVSAHDQNRKFASGMPSSWLPSWCLRSLFTFVRFGPTPLGKKRFRWENCVFLHTLFLEHEAQINKNNCRTMLFKSTQVSLPKTSSILQEMKIDSKNDMRPCWKKALNNYSNKNIYIIYSIFKYIWIAVLTISWNKIIEGPQCPLQCPKKWNKQYSVISWPTHRTSTYE